MYNNNDTSYGKLETKDDDTSLLVRVQVGLSRFFQSSMLPGRRQRSKQSVTPPLTPPRVNTPG